MSPDSPAVSVPIGRTTAQPAEPAAMPVHPAGPEFFHTPLIDIHETADGLVLEADLPGVGVRDLAIELEENVLSLRARPATPTPEGARVLHEEYRPGGFQRSFILSDEVDRARISAELRNGVLRLLLPKAERLRPRKIEITTAK